VDSTNIKIADITLRYQNDPL